MILWFSLFVVLAVASIVLLIVLPKRRKGRQVEKFVCDICHGTDCDCRRQDSTKR